MDSKTGEPIIGATDKGAETVVTNTNGEFSVNAGSEIIVSNVGYETITVKSEKTFITIPLQQSTSSLSEVVVNAYGAKRQLLTVAAPIAVINRADLNCADNSTLIPVLNISRRLRSGQSCYR